MVLVLLGLHAALAALAPLLHRWLARRALLVAGVAPASVALWAAITASDVVAGQSQLETIEFAPSFGFQLAFRVDPFSLLMSFVVSAIGVLIFAYSYSYFGHSPLGLAKFTSWMLVFSGSMQGLVLSDNLLELFAFWELTSIASYMLIGFYDKDEAARAGALQALLITGLGGIVMLAGFVLLGTATGTYSIGEILRSEPRGPIVDAAAVCILVGAFTKSAQVPFHSWLPSAMAAPTPASAYLHAATMVKAGIFLIARLSPALGTTTFWRPVCFSVGLATMLTGSYRALRQYDLKLILAYATVSQLGAMVALFGLATPETALAGVVVLIAHSMYKASTFMSAGIVEKVAGTRDIRELNSMGRQAPALFIVTALATASMAGLPPFAGFLAKEEMIRSVLVTPLGQGPSSRYITAAALTAVVVSSGLTLAYSARFLRGAFGSRSQEESLWGRKPAVAIHTSKLGWAFLLPAVLLAGASLLVGIYPRAIEWLAVPAAGAVSRVVSAGSLSLPVTTGASATAARGHLRLWHGFSTPLSLSILGILVGLLLYRGRLRIEKLQLRLPRFPGSLEAYRVSLEGLLRLASRATGLAQCGSLPVYLAVIALVAVVLPAAPIGWALLSVDMIPSMGPAGLFVLAVGAAIVGLAVGVASSRRRFRAVLMLGGVGYGVGVLFVTWGAPDLALTQFLVETLLVIVFVLVLRHLPPDFAKRPAIRSLEALRIVVAFLVGVLVYAFAAASTAAREVLPISQQLVPRATAEAHAKNIVNAVVVDFRAFDTMGEIIVLVVAAMGVAALAKGAGRSWPRGAATAPSLILETGSRAVFHTILVLALFLFFSGHNAPGGGFVAGLVAGSAFVVWYLAYGADQLSRTARLRSEVFMGAGLLVALASGVAPLLWANSAEAFDFGFIQIRLPLLGELATSTSLAFDAGVFLVVIGLVAAFIQTLGVREVR